MPTYVEFVNDQDPAGPLTGEEKWVVVQDGEDVQVSIADIADFIGVPPDATIGQTGGSIWEFEAATTTPPGTGKIRFDSATVAAVTNVYISQTSLNGTDVVDFLYSIMIGDSVFIQDRTFPDRWFRGKIMSGISDNGDWWTIPIHVVTGSGLMVVPASETIVRFSMNSDNTPVAELSWKDPVDMATTGPITLSGEQTIDGQATSTSRVLVKDQANPEFNGLYTSGAGAWTRTTDADTADELEGAIVNVLTGTVNHDKNFVMISDDVILNTTWILWEDLTDSPSIVVPATDTVAGIMKKYGTTGSNTDGTMDQNSITNAINSGVGSHDILSASVVSTTLALDGTGESGDLHYYVATAISANTTLTVANMTNVRSITITIKASSTWKLSTADTFRGEKGEARWDNTSSSKGLTITAPDTGNPYVISLIKQDTYWLLRASGAYYTS